MKPKQPGVKRSLSDRYEAALAFVISGSDAEASVICGIPRDTLQDWRGQEWWPELVAKAREAKQRELDGKFTGIIHKATKEIVERIENGDDVVAKDGSLVKRKVGAKELAIIVGIMSTQQGGLRGSRLPVGKSSKQALQDKKEELENLGQEASKPVADSATGDNEKVH